MASVSDNQTFASVPMAIAPSQKSMFLRKAKIEYPPKEHSADSLGEVEADDQHRYYVKGDIQGKLVRASEWLSTNISEAIGIGAPTPAPIELKNGTVVFGSRRIANVSDSVVTANYHLQPSAANIGNPAAGLTGILSAIYAFDMFIHNENRHFGNYLSVDDNGTRRVYAFDYSRALFWQWPWQSFPHGAQHTRTRGRILRSLHGFDEKSAYGTLDRLSGLASNTIEGFINEMPTDWLPNDTRAQLLSWWSSGAKDVRLNELRAGITDGTLL